MNDAQSPCGKFIYIALDSFFSVFHSHTWLALIDRFFFKLLKIMNAQFAQVRVHHKKERLAAKS